MSIAIIQQRLLDYSCQTILEQESALKEIAQEIALLALARAGFFQIAAFQGGTCLRILYGLSRFSEDLDFVLTEKNTSFDWKKYLIQMQEEFSAFGYTLEIREKSSLDSNVKKAFLKAESLGGILIVKDLRTNRPKLRIKLEIDTNPPAGSNYELKYLDFPTNFAIKSQNLPSLFAGKCHALLCRNYVKGRDWYDFLWYIARNGTINYQLLTAALNQTGPWQNQAIEIDKDWLITNLAEKITSIDWQDAKQDITRFIQPNELESLNLWSNEFFLSKLTKLQ